MIGTPSRVKNSEYTKEIFMAYQPNMEYIVKTTRGEIMFDEYYAIAESKIRENVFGLDYKQAMTWCIAHYLDLWNRDYNSDYSTEQQAKDSSPQGIIIEKIDYSDVMQKSKDATFWNQTKYGQRLMNLLYSKGILTMFIAS